MLVSIAQAQVFFLALTRVLMIMLALPFLGGTMIPNQTKLILGIILTMFVLPWQTTLAANTEAIPLLPFAAFILQELIIGALAGMSATLMFSAFQVAAKMMEMSAGFSAGQIFNPTLNDTGSAYDQFFVMIVYLYFLTINGHHVFIIGLQKTFQVMPILSPLTQLLALAPERLIQLFSSVIASGIQMSLPVVGAVLLADVTFGLLNKVAPQIQVFFLGLNIKIVVGLLGVAITFSFILPMIKTMIDQMGIMMIKLLGA